MMIRRLTLDSCAALSWPARDDRKRLDERTAAVLALGEFVLERLLDPSNHPSMINPDRDRPAFDAIVAHHTARMP